MKNRTYKAQRSTWSKVCWAKSVVDIITPAINEPNSRLRPSLSLHWKGTPKESTVKGYDHLTEYIQIAETVNLKLEGYIVEHIWTFIKQVTV